MFDRALKLVRQYHRLNQLQMAERLEISPSYLSEIENGKKVPSLDILIKYSDVAGVPVSSLVFLAEEIGNGKPEGVKGFMADKVLKMLEWITDGENEEKKRAEFYSA